MLVCLCLVFNHSLSTTSLGVIVAGDVSWGRNICGIYLGGGLPTSNLVQEIEYSEDYLGYPEFFKENPRVVTQIRSASVPNVRDTKFQGVSSPWRPIVFFCNLAQCICGSSVLNLLCVTIRSSKIFMCLIDFWKFCAPLAYVFLSNPIAP